MTSRQYSSSKFANNDRFRAECEKLGIAPERVFDALYRTSPLDAEDERILMARADNQYLPEATGDIIGRSGVIDYPAGVTDRAGYCRELMRSVRRKQAIRKDELMTPNEHRALGVFRGWYEMYKDTDESVREGEKLAREAMPSVVALTDATFDEAFRGYVLPTVVYFHGSSALSEPKASLRMEKLAQRVAPYGRVARVNASANPGLRWRFKISPKPEPLLFFSLRGSLKDMISSAEPLDVIAERFEPHVASMRRTMTDPARLAKLEQIRAGGNKV